MASNMNVFVPRLNGRKVLYTSYEEVNDSNIIEVLKEVCPSFYLNQQDILYLEAYRRGVQPILYREKTVRPEINNKIVKNRANEIVDFKTGYLLGEPIQYVARNGAVDEELLREIDELNNYCYLNKKSNLDKELADYMYTCGTAYRMVLPSKDKNSDVPFNIYTVDPAFNAVVYSTAVGHPAVLSISEVLKRNEKGTKYSLLCCYTPTRYYEVMVFGVAAHRVDQQFVARPNQLGAIPLIEYPLNMERMGGFEVVIPLLDAINTVESNRVDAVEQAVQSIMVFYNTTFNEEDLKNLQDLGALTLTSSENGNGKQDVKYLSCDLNQSETQTLIKDLEEDVLTICGLPNRNGGSSTSDTGSAVIMRDGWSDAEARAKEDELSFKASEMDFLKLAVRITSTLNKTTLAIKPTDIDIRFTRRNYENIAQKTTVLTQLLGCDKVDPKYAFDVCGLFSDSQLAYEDSKAYYESIKEEDTPSEQNIDNADTN